jgi:PqqD family protein of HPr-rel-A system
MKWQIISSDQALYFHSWDNEYVVYNSLSGDTHILDLAAGQVLLKLQQSPTDAITLAKLVAPTDQSKSQAELELQIEHLLAELNTLNLIEKCQNTIIYNPPSCR